MEQIYAAHGAISTLVGDLSDLLDETGRAETRDNVEVALDLARQGVAIFPVGNHKRPLTEHGFKDATTDQDRIRAWWAQHPEALPAYATGAASGLAVLDLDMKDGRDGIAAARERGFDPETAPVKYETRTGGLHVVFAHRDGLRSSADPSTGIDVRAEGGYCVAWQPFTLPADGLPLWPDAFGEVRRAQRDAGDLSDLLADGPSVRDLALVPQALAAIDADCGRDTWFRVGAALHHAFNGSEKGLDLWLEWSRTSTGTHHRPLDERDARRSQWPSMGRAYKGEKATIDTLFYLARASCWDDPRVADEFDDLPPLPAALEQPWPMDPFEVDSEPDLSHDALAKLLGSVKWDADARYCQPLGGWLLWNGTHWRLGEDLRHMTLVRNYVRTVANNLMEWAEKRAAREEDPVAFLNRVRKQCKDIRQVPYISNVEMAARWNYRSASTPDQFDADDYVIGTPGGAVDLRTGELRPARRDDYITKLVACAPSQRGTKPERWLRFLGECFPNDPEIVAFLQRLSGYALTGLTSEHRLFFFQGTGRNGKSTFLTTIQDIMADYAKTVAPSVLMETRSPQHLAPLAALRGARMARASEISGGQSWNEETVKRLTGGDTITANRMRCDPFDFRPKLTLFVDANKLPRLRSADPAMQARMTLIPWRESFWGREDRGLTDALKAEAPSILRWMVDGAVDYLANGLRVPDAVEAASRAYMENEDTFGQFVVARTEKKIGARVSRDALFSAYLSWCVDERIEAMSSRAFNQVMRERDIAPEDKSNGARYWRGLIVREPAADGDGFDDL